MAGNSDENFFKPILSTFGLIITFIAAITPLLPFPGFKRYFVSDAMANPSSMVAVIFGLIITWNVINHPYIELEFGPFSLWKISISKKRLQQNSLIWLALFASLVLFAGFFFVKTAILQAVVYILFFSIVIFTFALLVSSTKSKIEYEARRDAQADIIFKTLERNKVINPGIAIYANEMVSQQEITELDIRNWGIFKKVKLETVPQPKEIIEVIMSNDYRELIKIIKKAPAN